MKIWGWWRPRWAERGNPPLSKRIWSKMHLKEGQTGMGKAPYVVVNLAIIAAGSLVVLSCILLAWILVGWLVGRIGSPDAVYPTAYVLLHAGIITAILLGVLIVQRELVSRQRMRDYKMRTGSNS
jgi:hypothetical protein